MRAIIVRFGAVFLVVAAGFPVRAQDWLEVRSISPPAGGAIRVDLGDTPQLLDGARGLVASVDGRWATIRVPTTLEEHRIRFDRPRLGPLELRIRPERNQLGAVPERERRVGPLPPPIDNAPPAFALVTPPHVSSESRFRDALDPSRQADRPAETFQPSPDVTPVREATPRLDREVVTAVERPVMTGSREKEESKPEVELQGRPDELAVYALAADLMKRGLYGEAIAQFERLLVEFPRTKLRLNVLRNIGSAHASWGVELEAEALRQQDLRRSGQAAEAIDAAIDRFGRAVTTLRDALALAKAPEEDQAIQVEIAEATHGQVRARFVKGGTIQDSPIVVVEYLKALGEVEGSQGLNARAKLGIARYFRDLGDARLLNRADKELVKRAYDRALEAYQEVILEAPDSSFAEEALIDLGRLYDRNLEMRRFELAVRHYDMLLARFPSSRFRAEAAERSKYIKENYL